MLAVIPPADGYGSQGNVSGGVKPTDTLVFVVDLIKAYAATSSAAGHAGFARRRGTPDCAERAGRRADRDDPPDRAAHVP